MPIDCLEHEWLETLFVSEELLPVLLSPPQLVVVKELAGGLQDIVGYRPNFFVNSKTRRLRGQHQDYRRREQLRLVRMEEIVGFLYETTVVNHSIHFVRQALKSV